MEKSLHSLDDAQPRGPAGAGGDLRLATLTASLRARYELAEQRHDADAKQALFKEAVYLGIHPDAYQGRTRPA